MRQKLIKFMQGRYGIDQYGKFILYLSLFMLILNCFINRLFLYYIGLFIMLYGYFRIFSRNLAKRNLENTKFLYYKEKVINFLHKVFCNSKAGYFCNKESDVVYEQKYKIFKCPSCKQKLRVPAGKGKIQITCRKCGLPFVKRT